MDTEHLGTENASVVFIPACPTTQVNKSYIKSQLDATRTGRPPPDYEMGAGLLDERSFVGYSGHSGLTGPALQALGSNV